MKPDFETTPQARYERLRELGRGENTRVELVYDRLRQLTLARKTWDRAGAELRFRLRQQHRRALSISHPNIVQVYDLTASPKLTCMTMEAVSGEEVTRHIQAFSEQGASDARRLGAALDALKQLFDALCTLHAADIVYRDIKPRNLLVEPASARLVLLDAGFASPPQSSVAADLEGAHPQLLPYVAPECLRGSLPSIESDWYGFGAVAGELLLGRPVFEGPPASVLRGKDAPIESLEGVPEALDDLIRALLSRDPRARPARDEIAEVLSAQCQSFPFDAAPVASEPPPNKPSQLQLKSAQIRAHEASARCEHSVEPAVGQPVALATHAAATLDRAPQAAPADAPIAMSQLARLSPELLQAPPSLLMGEVAAELAELVDDVLRALPEDTKAAGGSGSADTATITAHGPALGAADELMAALDAGAATLHESADLATCPPQEQAPSAAAPAQRIFAELEREHDAEAQPLTALEPQAGGDPAAQEASSRAEGALAQLEEQLAQAAPSSLLCLRGAPGSGKSRLMATLASKLARQPGHVALARAGTHPTALSAVRQLAQQLAQALGKDLSDTLRQIEPEQRSALARLCPALVARHDSTHIDASAANLQQRLIDAHLGLRSFVKQLCAGGPLTLMIDDAHGLDPDTLAALRAVLSSPAPAGLRVLVALDSDAARADVFGAMLDGLAHGQTSARMIELTPLEARQPQPAPGRPPLAQSSTAQATRDSDSDSDSLAKRAREASAGLALQHAADLYQRAVLCANPASDTLLQLAALSSCAAGRLREAAELWLSLARSTSDAIQAQRFELEAGACFLRAGNEERGLSIMRGVLRNVGLHWPRTPLLMSTVERARALLRQGSPSTPVTEAVVATHAQRFDALWGIAKELVLLAPPTADALCARALREAQCMASRSRALWALGYEAMSEANIGGSFMLRRAAALATRVRELAGASPNAYDLAYASSVEAITTWFQGDWADAEQRLRGALRAYTCLDAGTAQERHVLCNFLIGALEAQGKIEALREVVAEERISALQSGHRHALALCELSAMGLPELAHDRALEAIDRADALLCAHAAESGFTPLHFQHFVVTTQARLYAGHHAQAYQQVEQAWQHIRRSHLAQLEGVSVMVQQLRARAVLALATQSEEPQARELRARALKLAASLGRSALTHALALRHVIEANAAVLARQRSSAEAHCIRASELFDVADMPLMRETARMARGIAGESIEARLDAAQGAAFLREAGVRDGARFAAAWFPALRGALLDTPLTH